MNRPGAREPESAGAPADAPAVSIVVPARNEERLLPAALASALAQDYPGKVEVVVADGSDGSGMAEMVRARFPEMRIVPNPDRHIPAGLNRALRAASHDIVARCDARCELPPGYLRAAVATLRRTGAANVGGLQRPVGTGPFTGAVALAMTSRLGAGDARYRLGGAEGPADTVFLGVFRREALESAGGFDETLRRNEDYALNWTLRRRGETVWLDPSLEVAYRPRERFAALAAQYFANGWWKRLMLLRHPRSRRWRQLAAPALTVGLAGSAVLAAAGLARAAGFFAGASALPPANALIAVGAALPAAYALLLLGAGAAAAARGRGAAAPLLPAVLATMHIAWGAGFWCAWALRRRARLGARGVDADDARPFRRRPRQGGERG